MRKKENFSLSNRTYYEVNIDVSQRQTIISIYKNKSKESGSIRLKFFIIFIEGTNLSFHCQLLEKIRYISYNFAVLTALYIEYIKNMSSYIKECHVFKVLV